MQIRKTLKKYNRISLRCEKCDIGMPVLLSTHTHTLAGTLTRSLAHTDTIFVFVSEVIFLESCPTPQSVLLHLPTHSSPPPPIRAIQKQFSKLCRLPSLRPSGGTGNGKANPISFLGTQPGQMESAAACYLLRAPIHTHPIFIFPFSLPRQDQETRASSQ